MFGNNSNTSKPHEYRNLCLSHLVSRNINVKLELQLCLFYMGMKLGFLY
jgi:hypothetical protein